VDIFNNVDKDEVDIDSDDFELEELQDLTELPKKPKKTIGDLGSLKGAGTINGSKIHKTLTGSFLKGIRKGSSNQNLRFGKLERGSTNKLNSGSLADNNKRPSHQQFAGQNFSIMELKEQGGSQEKFHGIGYDEGSVVGVTQKNLEPTGLFGFGEDSPPISKEHQGTMENVINQNIDDRDLNQIKNHQTLVMRKAAENKFP
jgi:hypothetical protein